MPRTYRLERAQHVDRPVAETFEFFANAANLERITPASLKFHIDTPQPIELKSGTLIDYRLRLCGVPLRWRTRIEEFERGKRFVDVQLRGPYRLWRHTHEFTAEGAGTRMTDCVEYALPLGPLGRIAHAVFVRRMLGKIFDYRAQQIAELMASECSRVAP